MQPRTYTVLQVIPNLSEGGVERGVVELNRLFVKAGWRNVVLTRGGKLCQQIVADGGEVVLADVASKNILTALPRAWKLRAILRKIKPDIIHVRSRVPGWLIRLTQTKIPIVTTVHGINHVGFYSRIMTRGARNICPSSFVAQFIQNTYHVPQEKVRVILRGIDPTAFNIDTLDLDFKREFSLKHNLEGHFVVLAVGRITPLKGLDILIRAVARLKAKIPNVRLLVVGGVAPQHHDYLQRLNQLAKELHIDQDVSFAGSQSKLAEIYSCASVTVSATTTKPETFGRSMAESLAMNTPVVATRHGGALDIVREGIDGFLVTPGNWEEMADALLKIPQLERTNLRNCALTRFSLQRMADSTLSVYKEILE